MGSELLSARLFLHRLAAKTPAGERRWLVAVSGGRDSMCLLHLTLQWGRENGVEVAAAHFNHRLRGETADRDEAFVRDFCRTHGVPFVRGEGDTRALAKHRGMTIEEAGRTLRYAFLERTAAERGCQWILTAHHAGDNAETMLLNLCRGTGGRGLSGIPQVRGQVARPLLQIPREEIEGYVARHGILYVEDETNFEDDAARNLLRHQVLPVLCQVNPRAVENMSRTAGILRREGEAIDQAAAALMEQARGTWRGLRISREALAAAPEAVAARAVLTLLERLCGHSQDLTAVDVGSVLAVARAGREAQERRLSYGLLVYREGADVVITLPPPRLEPVSLQRGETAVFGGWRVSLRETPGAGECFALRLPPLTPTAVTLWRREDRFRLSGSRGERSLKRLYAERGVRPYRRDTLPVLRAGEVPAAAAGVGVNAQFTPAEGEKPVFVIFQQIERGE